MIWLRYWFSSLKKIVGIEVSYSLITKSGNEIYSIEEDFIPEELIIKKVNEWDWRTWDNLVKEKWGEKFNDKARQLLINFQKKERKKIKYGWIDSGDYVVKCVWDISVEREWLDYKEFKDYIRLISDIGKKEVAR